MIDDTAENPSSPRLSGLARAVRQALLDAGFAAYDFSSTERGEGRTGGFSVEDDEFDPGGVSVIFVVGEDHDYPGAALPGYAGYPMAKVYTAALRKRGFRATQDYLAVTVRPMTEPDDTVQWQARLLGEGEGS